MFVASSVRMTFAPGMTAPEESVTTPVSCAVYEDCALARGIRNASAKTKSVPEIHRKAEKLNISHPQDRPGKISFNFDRFRLVSVDFFYFPCQARTNLDFQRARHHQPEFSTRR